jgi:REP-associated tyrosine transposase
LKPTRIMSPPGTYFVTFLTWQRRRLFVVDNYARLFLKTLYGYRRQGMFRLHAFVLMPENVHLLLTPARDVTLERTLQLIKGGYSRAFGLEFGPKDIWQRGFTDHRIEDAEDYDRHRDYIHQNPVKRRLVENAIENRCSSAYPGFKLDEQTSAAKADCRVAAQLARVNSCPSRSFARRVSHALKGRTS